MSYNPTSAINVGLSKFYENKVKTSLFFKFKGTSDDVNSECEPRMSEVIHRFCGEGVH
ncbi:hypothetical protein PAUR_a2275 [Pseudoalteromonas aurantia 208]|uniref:Uncharacterized protein n=1 Tax=Pseudoalteromonas aurantia 208 TaxID=1314867 RepID=A0ABR9EFV8_9GAMM|nr:hypothetical protein [Pseudoalteromonas aurantia 208]